CRRRSTRAARAVRRDHNGFGPKRRGPSSRSGPRTRGLGRASRTVFRRPLAVRCQRIVAVACKRLAPMRLGEVAQRLVRESVLESVPTEVAQRDDAYETVVAVEHRKSSYLALAHLAEGLLERVDLSADEERGRHHFARLAVARVPPGDDRAQQSVTIGQD